MANLFIGFPVPRAKIADMIEGAAPPLEHVTNHLPPGSDPLVLPGDISENQILKWNGTKFVGSDAPAGNGYTSPMSIPPSAFFPEFDTVDFQLSESHLRKLSTFDSAYFYAPVILPHGATITKVTLFGYRQDNNAYLDLFLNRVTNTAGSYQMALIYAEWTDGNGSAYDDTISDATIDNNSNSYHLKCKIQCNDHFDDVKLIRVQIDFS